MRKPADQAASGRVCSAKTRAGEPCRAKAGPSGFCHAHSPGVDMRSIGAQGGRGRRKAKPATPAAATLREIKDNQSYPAYARAAAAGKLLALEGEEPSDRHWTRSVQVREDFEPPSWPEILRVARESEMISLQVEIGAIPAAEVVGVFAAKGLLGELRAAVERLS